MTNHIQGIHHITAIAGDAKKNFDFYTKILGLRFLKRTVNFDDPQTYHFYFGDEQGTPGTILTFFPWGSAVHRGRRGSGMATELSYAVPENSFEFWMNRFKEHNVIYNNPAKKFGTDYLTFLDPDGLKIELVATNDQRMPFVTDEVNADVATRGFYNATLSLNNVQPTAKVLTDVLGYKLVEKEVNRYRYATDAINTANIIDLVEVPGEQRGLVAGGTIHHIAFRVKDDEAQMAMHEKVLSAGLQITPQIDRNYFHSMYFREPGGVLFEIATDNPGFTVDEPLNELGKSLKLPAQYESMRDKIEKHLVSLE